MGGATGAADDGLFPCGLGWCRHCVEQLCQCENAKRVSRRVYDPFEDDVVYNVP